MLLYDDYNVWILELFNKCYIRKYHHVNRSFGLLRVPFVNCCQFMYLVISLLVLRAGYGTWLYQFLIIAFLFTLLCNLDPSGPHVYIVKQRFSGFYIISAFYGFLLFLTYDLQFCEFQIGSRFSLCFRYRVITGSLMRLYLPKLRSMTHLLSYDLSYEWFHCS